MRNVRGRDLWVATSQGEQSAYLILSGQVEGIGADELSRLLSVRFKTARLSSDAVSFVVNEEMNIFISVRNSGDWALIAFVDSGLEKRDDAIAAAQEHTNRVFEEMRRVADVVKVEVKRAVLCTSRIAIQASMRASA